MNMHHEFAPIHVVYGGADRFKPDTPKKLAVISAMFLKTYASDEKEFSEAFEMDKPLAFIVRERVAKRLSGQAVQDFRADFEDGFGYRPSGEEDEAAIRLAAVVAEAMEAGSLSPKFGIRPKAPSAALFERSVRTTELFLNALRERTEDLPSGFVITLPKIESADQVAKYVEHVDRIEGQNGHKPGSICLELMIETPQALVTSDGRDAIPMLVEACDGRCESLHFGAYDFLSSVGIDDADFELHHPLCDTARQRMQLTGAPLGMRWCDGVTTTLPIEIHRGAELSDEQRAENMESVHRGWRLAYNDIRQSMSMGFFQGWDVHPAQLVARYAAVYAASLEHADGAAKRLANFLEQATRATSVGADFDDAATANGLLNFFRRGMACGALTEDDLQSRGLDPHKIRAFDFAALVTE
ncbi:MAG: phosphoenolpyruvate kinase [Planctomycetota bacterium]